MNNFVKTQSQGPKTGNKNNVWNVFFTFRGRFFVEAAGGRHRTDPVDGAGFVRRRSRRSVAGFGADRQILPRRRRQRRLDALRRRIPHAHRRHYEEFVRVSE